MDIEKERKDYEERNKLKKLVAPDVSTRKETRTKINDTAYFVVIVIVSLLVLFLPPLFTGCLKGDISFAFPKTIEGWILWTICSVSTAVANISILILFKLQAKKNCRKDQNFIKANEILHKLAGEKEVFIPRSPKRMNIEEYSKKVIFILLSTVGSFITLTSLILSFDWMALVSCAVSVIISLVLGWTTMIKNEEYWTEEYILYAQIEEKKFKNRIESVEKTEELDNKEAKDA